MNFGLSALVVGHVTLDRYGSQLLPGGGAYYGAQTLAGLGSQATLLTTVGDDFSCPSAFEHLQTHIERSKQTTTFLNLYPAAGIRQQWLLGQATPIRPTLLPAQLQKPDVLFLSPVFGELDLRQWTEAVSARLVGISIQGLIRAAGEAHPTIPQARRVLPMRYPADRDSLANVDAAVLSEEDLVGQGDLLDRLRRAIPIVALTCGVRGATLFRGTQQEQIGIFQTQEVDPTGAGDTFAAAFLFGLAQGLSLREAGRLGAAAASIVVEGQGGTTLRNIPNARQRVANVTETERGDPPHFLTNSTNC